METSTICRKVTLSLEPSSIWTLRFWIPRNLTFSWLEIQPLARLVTTVRDWMKKKRKKHWDDQATAFCFILYLVFSVLFQFLRHKIFVADFFITSGDLFCFCTGWRCFCENTQAVCEGVQFSRVDRPWTLLQFFSRYFRSFHLLLLWFERQL